MNHFTELLHWRYATKKMTGEKIPAEILDEILEAIRLAPTSRGLQPFKIFIIEADELKAKIQPIADNQPQVVECSHLLVFAAWSKISPAVIDDFIRYAADVREVPEERLEKMKAVIVRDQLPMTDEQFYQWASKQSYIALGFALIAAAMHKVDAAAMEGFLPAEVDKLLQLEKQGLRSTVLLGLGYRDVANDWLLKMKKVRRPAHELFETVAG
ncbi:MAG: NAD(P)H-dependent oxidoreductase [Ferruginibacter sp.]